MEIFLLWQDIHNIKFTTFKCLGQIVFLLFFVQSLAYILC